MADPTQTSERLRRLMGGFEDTHELVFPAAAPVHHGVRWADELLATWAAARAESNLLYDDWRAAPGREAYCAYRAAEDRADAAQDALRDLHVAMARRTAALAPA